MKIFVAGATGVVGRQLVPMLVARGHEVTAMTRSPGKDASLRAIGATAVAVADGLDRESVLRAVTRSKPEVVVHQLTALAGTSDFKNFDRSFALTNQLRTEGTDHLLEGARAAGARRFVAQSYTGWPFAREGGPVKTEDDPLDPDPPARMRQTLEAIRHVEAVAQAAGIEGLALRYAGFYGPGTSVSPDGEIVAAVRKRKLPIVGSGAGVWSFIHIEDAAAATLAAIEGGAPGVYNIADDDPAPVSVWLPALAAAVGAKPPMRVPAWLAWPLAGAAGISMMTRIRGASNAKARREFSWELRYPSWRQGFRTGLGDTRRMSDLA